MKAAAKASKWMSVGHRLPSSERRLSLGTTEAIDIALERLDTIDRLLQANSQHSPSSKVLNEARLRVLHQLASAAKALSTARNIDVGRPNKDRAIAYEALVRQCTTDIGGNGDVVKFLVRTAWHEGAKIKKRIQDPKKPGDPPGPARSFLQMEAQSAKDAIERAGQKSWMDELALVSGKAESNIKSAGDELPKSGQTPYFPNGNLIGSLLESDDLFGIYLGRIYITRTSDEVGSTRDKQADFWEDHWHKIKDQTKKQQFIDNAKEVDSFFGWA
jgi:hypothetical protein